MSLVEALSRAITRVRIVCFTPFDASRWLLFGVAAFLATCGESAAGPWSGSGGDGSGDGPTAAEASRALAWVMEHGVLVAAIAVAAAVVGFVLLAVVLWVSSHGKLVFVDGIARNRVQLGEAWRAHAAAARSLFLLRLGLGAAFLLLFLVLGASMVVPVLQLVSRGWAAALNVGVLATAGVGFLLLVLLAVAVNVVIDDLLVPALYLRGGSAREAWSALRPALAGRLGEVVLYVVGRLLVGAAVGTLFVVGGFLTCCVGFIPLVAHVLFLPLHVFLRSISLHWLEQLGPEWDVFAATRAGGAPAEGGGPTFEAW